MTGTVGGDIALALFSAAAFATILAVVAGLVIATAGAIAHDLWKNVLGRGTEESERKVARIAAVGVGVAAILGTLAIGSGFNVTVLVSMAFVFAASANFPPLLLALLWRRFNTTGALTGIAFGITASVIMIVLSPPVWPGPDSQGSPSSLTFPGLVTIPIGFLGCWLGTMLSRREEMTDATYDELLVRSETGIGSEGGPEPRKRPVRAHHGAVDGRRQLTHSPRARRAASRAPPCAPPRSPSSASRTAGGSSSTNRCGLHRLADALHPRLAEPDAEPAADHHGVRVEQVDRGGDAVAERLDRVLEQLERHLVVARQRALPDPGGQAVAAALLHDLEQDGLLLLLDAPARAGLHRAAAGVGLHAPAAPAAALGAVDAHDHVADLAGGPAADPRLALEHQPAADAGAPEDAEQRFELLARRRSRTRRRSRGRRRCRGSPGRRRGPSPAPCAG